MNIHRIRHVTWSLFWHSDTTIVHLILASASVLWAAVMFFADPPATAAFRVMFFIPPEAWGTLFALHVALVNWCIYSEKYSHRCSVFVHSFGVAIWLSATILMNLGVGRFTPSTALEVVMCAFALWALFRAGLKSDRKN